MKKEEFMSYCKENKKKIIIVGILLLVVLGCGAGAYVMSNNDKSKSNQKVNYLDYVSGIRDWSIQKGTKKVNYLEGVTWSKEYINKVTVDDSKVRLNKEGTYDLVYKVDVKKDGEKDVAKKVKVNVISKDKEDTDVKNKDENKVDTPKKDNSSNKIENSKPSKNEDKPSTKPTKPAEKPSPKPSKPADGSSSRPSKPSHTHKWEEQFKVVHHEEVGHYEKRKVKDAWVEEEPIYDMVPRHICNTCGQDITGNVYDHIDKHILDGTDKGWRTEYIEMQVGTNKIEHPAEYKDVWVVDQAAWDEKVSNGFVCSCGARK